MPNSTSVFAVSDFSGETASRVARSAISQFPNNQFKIISVTGVCKNSQIDNLIKRAKKGPSVIFFTLVKPEFRQRLMEKTKEAGVPAVDIFGPAVQAVDLVTGQHPMLEPGPMQKMDREYFNWVEAVQFAVRHDDGADTAHLAQADIVLIGVSRTGKTPLTIFLAYRGWKAANVPIIYGFPPPKELFEIDSKKIIGLTINPRQLTAIRDRRLQSVSGLMDVRYANPTYIHKELKYSQDLMQRLGCYVIDVTGKAVEETAHEILTYIQSERESLV